MKSGVILQLNEINPAVRDALRHWGINKYHAEVLTMLGCVQMFVEDGSVGRESDGEFLPLLASKLAERPKSAHSAQQATGEHEASSLMPEGSHIHDIVKRGNGFKSDLSVFVTAFISASDREDADRKLKSYVERKIVAFPQEVSLTDDFVLAPYMTVVFSDPCAAIVPCDENVSCQA